MMSLIDMSTHYFALAGVADRVTLHTGRAQDVIPSMNYTFDLVFIDGDRESTVNTITWFLIRFHKGGIVIADNVLWGGKIEGEEALKRPSDKGSGNVWMRWSQ